MNRNRITLRAFIWGAFFSALFAVLTVYIENRSGIIITSTQIPVLPCLLLLVTALLINPLCRLMRIVRPFSYVEIMIIFMMGMVSAGLSTFGLSSQLVPIAGNLFNGEWNNRQLEWNQYVVPYLNEDYFVSTPGIQQTAREYREALIGLQEKMKDSPAEIDKAKQTFEEAEKKLLALEQPVFDRIVVFRRGLPRDQRAFPGVLPLNDDNLRSYLARLKRLVNGREALNQVKQVWQSAGTLPAENSISPELTVVFQERFERAVNALSGLINLPELEKISGNLRSQEQALASQRTELAEQLRAVSEQKSKADRALVRELDGKSRAIIGELNNVDHRHKHYKTGLEFCHRETGCATNVQDLVNAIGAVQKQLAAGGMRAGDLKQKTLELTPRFPGIDISLRRYFLGQVPWQYWLKPLSRWAVLIGLTYIVLMSLNVLIFRQWAHNERLTYPLAELFKSMIGEPGAVGGFPALFKSGLFWGGAAISMGVMGWNLFCSTQIVPGLAPFDLIHTWQDYLSGTKFAAWRTIYSQIFFTMIGLAFLVPKNISFSLWFFYVVYMVQLLIMVTFGYGQNANSFPSDWWYLTSFRNAQGQGAMLIFSSYVLYKCRKYILCALFPSSVGELEAAERMELRISSLAFLGCSLGLILMLWLSMGANLFYTILFYVIMLVITIGLIRAVTEGGLLSFQANGSMFHYIRNFFGFNHSWTSATLFAPLMVYCAIMFLDIKTCIAPAMANALKMREDYRVRRLGFHIAVALAIILASCVAVATTLMMCYQGGADTMHDWFHTGLPKGEMFETIRAAIKDAPTAATGNIAWTIGGAVAMAALLFFRQFFFWMPHPIGLIMLVNPLMNGYWFSIFLGWLCNVAITSYGNKDTFHRAKGFFIGLIVGELIIVLASFFVTIVFGTMSGIDLNRGEIF